MESIKILYIEDQQDVRTLTCNLLKRRYTNVFTAENGKAGLEIFEQEKPQIVVTDIRMPVMDGLTLCKEIKKKCDNCRFILTTAHSDIDYFLQSIEIGINHYILKPIDPDLLFAAVDNCIKEFQTTYDLERKTKELQQMNLRLMDEIEQRNILEKDLIKAKEKAEEADRLKTSFLANMSHEIRTPLNGILGFAELLKNSKVTQEKRERYISIINESGRDLLNIINDVLDLAKIEACQIMLSPTDFSLNTMINELYVIYEADISIKGKPIVLKKVTELPDDKSYINGDDIRIKQIFKNLISNAIKFTPEGSIEFGYKINNKKIHLFVKDSGIGIDTSNHAFIFDRFRQEDETTTREFGGTGLGLSIAKSLTELMGGQISVESEKGKGALFAFSIPYINVVRNEYYQVFEKVNRYNWEDMHILIVEDHQDTFLYLKDLLEETKARISWAKN